MYRGFKVRIYPTNEQKVMIWKHINTCRFVWNYMLEFQINNYKNGGKHLNNYAMNKMLTPLKKEKEYEWLNEVSIHSLQLTCKNLEFAYKMFFNGVCGYPKFKSKKNTKQSYPVTTNWFYLKDGYAQVQKVGKIRYKTDYDLDNKFDKYYNVWISYDCEKYYLSFSTERDKQTSVLSEYSVGIDLGIKDLAIVAYGDKKYVFHNINKSKTVKTIEQKIKVLQRIVSRKYECSKKKYGHYKKSNNIAKIEKEIRRLYRRKSNINKNYIHQTTHSIVLLLPQRIVMEDLNVVQMLKNKHLSKYVQEQNFHEFIRQMEYKCELYGVGFIKADRYFPSSKTCSCCGAIKKNLKLSDRTYKCDECGLIIDRDYNAALNLMMYSE